MSHTEEMRRLRREAIAEQLGNTVAVVQDVYADYKLSPEERRSDGHSAKAAVI